MELENAPVGKLFRDRRDLPDEVRKVPFALESVQLEPADTRLLEASGALFRENDRYWIPEIYRHGLKFGVSGGAGQEWCRLPSSFAIAMAPERFWAVRERAPGLS
ncbi:hypothetical protein ACFVSN_37615 [Kitasatospora sp. NPDC057904]|uniref:hypothetical protein n=1 Tax=Kitasatospora sp. NPDC057904 TaxID=3346275 RepID=UPI0036DEBC82